MMDATLAQQPTPVHVDRGAGHKVVFDQKQNGRGHLVYRAWTWNTVFYCQPFWNAIAKKSR